MRNRKVYPSHPNGTSVEKSIWQTLRNRQLTVSQKAAIFRKRAKGVLREAMRLFGKYKIGACSLLVACAMTFFTIVGGFPNLLGIGAISVTQTSTHPNTAPVDVTFSVSNDSYLPIYNVMCFGVYKHKQEAPPKKLAEIVLFQPLIINKIPAHDRITVVAQRPGVIGNEPPLLQMRVAYNITPYLWRPLVYDTYFIGMPDETGYYMWYPSPKPDQN